MFFPKQVKIKDLHVCKTKNIKLHDWPNKTYVCIYLDL